MTARELCEELSVSSGALGMVVAMWDCRQVGPTNAYAGIERTPRVCLPGPIEPV